jgi:mannose-6-phosphate isomerase
MKMANAGIDAIFTETRPWGQFEQFVSNTVTTVKIITVQPSQRLSLQRHQLRDELWRILDGPVDITLNHREWRAEAGDTIWIPRTSVHRMGNTSDREVRVLEMAFGTFDELDIERLADDYQRTG